MTVETVLSVYIDAGKLFHVRGPVTGNERSPTVTNRERGTKRISVSTVDLNRRLESMSATRCSDVNGLTSNSQYLCSNVSTGLRRLTSPMNFIVVQLIPKCDADSARHRHLYWSSVELASRPLAIGHFRSLRHAYGTIIHSTLSRHLPLESLKIV